VFNNDTRKRDSRSLPTSQRRPGMRTELRLLPADLPRGAKRHVAYRITIIRLWLFDSQTGGQRRRKPKEAGEIIPVGAPEEKSPEPVATPFIPCDGTQHGSWRRLMSSSSARLFNEGSSMAPIIGSKEPDDSFSTPALL